ncbi:MAG: ASCH domain-containing protein [Pseudomonadota bacterium]
MDAELRCVLAAVFPGEEARYFPAMSIGKSPDVADQGAALILNGVKTLTSSPFWDYPDGRIPFVGALSVLLDGARTPRGIVETTRVEIMPFGAVTEDLADAYGEGDRTADWWRRTMGAFYQDSARHHGAFFTDDTPSSGNGSPSCTASDID